MEIHEYLNTNYPHKEERKKMTRLVLNNKSLTGELIDLSDFVNLEELDLSNNKVHGYLKVFTDCPKLNDLRIGSLFSKPKEGITNNFLGSLSDLRNLNLKYLDISENKAIEGDMNVLPITLKIFQCHKVIFDRVMKHFDYDLEAWRLCCRPELFTEQEWEEKVEKSINDTQYYLSIVGENLSSRYNSDANDLQRFRVLETQKNRKVALLQSKLLEIKLVRAKNKINYLEISLEASKS